MKDYTLGYILANSYPCPPPTSTPICSLQVVDSYKHVPKNVVIDNHMSKRYIIDK